MITDTIDKIENYYCMHEELETVFKHVQEKLSVKIEPGRYDIQESEAYFLVQQYKPKDPDEGKWESHRDYIDVQYVLSGIELIGYSPVSCLQADSEYHADRDVIRYTGGGGGCFIHAPAGTFFIFFPQDGHMPAISHGNSNEVSKVVMKLPVSVHGNPEREGGSL